MKYTLHHFTVDKEGNEPENSTSTGEFTVTELAEHEYELMFLYTHNNQVHKERWVLPSRHEAEGKIKSHLEKYFKSWDLIDPEDE